MVFAKLELSPCGHQSVQGAEEWILETWGAYDRETMRQPESHKRISDGLPHAGDY